jgi:polyphosphate kinase 2 (PPK2 family)
VVALGKPSDRQEHEWYFQRYTSQLPVSGEFVLFNRSWYNRAGVEKVMGFCSNKEYKSFFKDVELFEEMLVNGGFIVLKYYLDISMDEQEERLDDRRKDPLKQWKISPIDKEALRYWKDYSEARNEMLQKTNFKTTPWRIVNADKKKTTRIAIITDLLQHLHYHNKDEVLLSQDYGLIYSATPKNIKEKLY